MAFDSSSFDNIDTNHTWKTDQNSDSISLISHRNITRERETETENKMYMFGFRLRFRSHCTVEFIAVIQFPLKIDWFDMRTHSFRSSEWNHTLQHKQNQTRLIDGQSLITFPYCQHVYSHYELAIEMCFASFFFSQFILIFDLNELL